VKGVYTLTEFKEELRAQISESKDTIRRLSKTEFEGVGASGHYGKTGKFDMLNDLRAHVNILKEVLVLVGRVNALKRKRRAA
jgi:hypothetical protein